MRYLFLILAFVPSIFPALAKDDRSSWLPPNDWAHWPQTEPKLIFSAKLKPDDQFYDKMSKQIWLFAQKKNAPSQLHYEMSSPSNVNGLDLKYPKEKDEPWISNRADRERSFKRWLSELLTKQGISSKNPAAVCQVLVFYTENKFIDKFELMKTYDAYGKSCPSDTYGIMQHERSCFHGHSVPDNSPLNKIPFCASVLDIKVDCTIQKNSSASLNTNAQLEPRKKLSNKESPTCPIPPVNAIPDSVKDDFTHTIHSISRNILEPRQRTVFTISSNHREVKIQLSDREKDAGTTIQIIDSNGVEVKVAETIPNQNEINFVLGDLKVGQYTFRIKNNQSAKVTSTDLTIEH